MSRRLTWTFVGIAAVALAVRLLAIQHLLPDEPLGDNFYFHGQANLLADGHWYAHPFVERFEARIEASAIHPPLYVAYLAVGSVFGLTSFAAHAVMSAFLGVATAMVIGLAARRLAGDVAGVVAAGIVAVHPAFWLHDAVVMSESLYALLVASALLVALHTWDRPTTRRVAGLGAVCALAALTRGEALLLLPLLVWPVSRRSWRTLVVGTVAFVAVLGPWMIWNSARFGTPVLLSVNSSEVLALANCPETYYGNELGYWTPACYRGDPQGNEAERGLFWRERGLDYIGDHLGRVPYVVAARVGGSFGLYHPIRHVGFADGEGRPWGWSLAGQLAFQALLLPALAGAVLVVRRRETGWWVPLAPVAMVVATSALIYGSIRFRLALEVAEVLLVSVAAAALFARTERADAR
jgi:4-amino-4-deoxy-L-arabinose transferase-like glycosyltransferase